MKICLRCEILKPLNEFYCDKRHKDGVFSYCKECAKKATYYWCLLNPEKRYKAIRRWKVANPEKCHESVRRWVEANSERKREVNRRWYEANREKSREYSHRRRATLKGKLSHRMGGAINRALHGTKSGRKWERLVGYTVEHLKKHLEKRFTDGMNWENMGKWHIDHVIPISAFNFEKVNDFDFKRCWSLKNLQPLWAIENMNKHTKNNKPFQPSLLI